MTTENRLLQTAEAYAKEILVHHSHDDLKFHTISHTEQVVQTVAEIATKVGVSADETEILKIAAWFHDLGYTRIYDGHEQVSKQMARDFLTKNEVDQKIIDKVLDLIEATRLSIHPKNLHEQIIKDADLYNLATPEALVYTGKLRMEWETFCNRVFNDVDWYRLNLDFYKEHVYYTSYAKETFSPTKKENIKLLEDKLEKAEEVDPGSGTDASMSVSKELVASPSKKKKGNKKGRKELKKLLEKKDKELEKALEKKERDLEKLNQKLARLKEQKPDRGIETMFRTTYRTHIALSGIADNKANILLSINAIIISIISSSIIRQLEDHPLLIYPSIILLGVCMATIVFAILATRPKVSSGIFTREDIEEKRTNLLFFGNFHRMPLPDYQWGIREMMRDSDYLYGSMSKDIYFLGVVLAKKFQLLRIAYTIFMYGLLIAVIIFAFTFWIESQGN